MTVTEDVNKEYETFKEATLLLSKEEIFEKAIDIALYMYISDYIEYTATDQELNTLKEIPTNKKIEEICSYLTEFDINEDIASIIAEDL